MRLCILTLVLIGCAAMALLACSGSDETKPGAQPAANTEAPVAPAPAAAPAAPAAPQTAAEVFKTRCVMCHGESGKGDGAAAAALNPKPRDYTDKAWQSTITDEQIAKAITQGGAAVGKSPVMPAHADLANQPEVLNGLVQHIRSFAAP